MALCYNDICLKYSIKFTSKNSTKVTGENTLTLGLRKICTWALVPPQAPYEVGQQANSSKPGVLQVHGKTNNAHCASLLQG